MATDPVKPIKPLSPFLQTIARSLWKEIEPQLDALFAALLTKVAGLYDTTVVKAREAYGKVKAWIKTYIGIKTV